MSTKPGELSRQLNERSKFREIKKGTRRKFKGSTFTWNGKRWIESAGAWKDLGRGIKNKLKIQKDKRTKTLIGKGTAKNPQFKTNRRGTKVSNPSYTPTKSRTWKNPVGAKGGGKPSSGDSKTWPKGKKKQQSGMPSNPKSQRQQGVGKSANDLSRHKTNKKTTPPKKDAWRTPEAEKWLKKTRNSPAAKAGFGEKHRWELQQKHRAWLAKRGR